MPNSPGPSARARNTVVMAASTAPSTWNAKPYAVLRITPWRAMPAGASGAIPLMQV